MNLRRMLLIITLIALTGLRALAQTTAQEDVLARNDDPRLGQKVILDADGVSVSKVLAQISGQTGVALVAGENKDDWMVQDRKLIIHLNDLAQSDVMREVGSVLRFHWSREGDAGKWTYRLSQDKQERAEEQSLRAGSEDARAKQSRRKRENALSDLTNLIGLQPSDAAKLKTTDPWRYILATEPLGRGIDDFIGSFTDARTAYLQGTDAGFPISTLPPQLQDTVRRIATSYDALTRSIGQSEDHSDLLRSFGKLQITINPKDSPAADVVSRSLLGKIVIGSETDTLDIPIFDPASPVAKALGRAILELKAGNDKEVVGNRLKAELLAANQATQESKQPARDTSSAPALQVRIKLFSQPTNATLPMILPKLAEASRINVISDFFPALPVTVSPDQTLGEALQFISREFGSDWTKSGNILRLSDREWFAKRAWEVPRVWMDYWIARGKTNNGLDLDDFVQIGSLRDEQIDHAIMLDRDLVEMGAGDASRNRYILRFYGMLTPDQRSAMIAKSLSVGQLDDAQWSALRKALAAKNAGSAAVEKGLQVIQLTQSGSDTEIVKYKFAFFPGPNQPPVTFELTKSVTPTSRQSTSGAKTK